VLFKKYCLKQAKIHALWNIEPGINFTFFLDRDVSYFDCWLYMHLLYRIFVVTFINVSFMLLFIQKKICIYFGFNAYALLRFHSLVIEWTQKNLFPFVSGSSVWVDIIKCTHILLNIKLPNYMRSILAHVVDTNSLFRD
jgi:hypothetical protein